MPTKSKRVQLKDIKQGKTFWYPVQVDHTREHSTVSDIRTEIWCIRVAGKPEVVHGYDGYSYLGFKTMAGEFEFYSNNLPHETYCIWLFTKKKAAMAFAKADKIR